MVENILRRPGRSAMMLVALTGAAVLTLANGNVLTAQEVDKTSAGKVKAKAESAGPNASGKQTITLTLDIDKGWHLHANPVKNETFEPNKTVVEVKGTVKPQSVTVKYPAGTVRDDGLGKYMAYEGRVTIPVEVQRAAGDTGPLQVVISVNACDKSRCLAPGKVTITVR